MRHFRRWFDVVTKRPKLPLVQLGRDSTDKTKRIGDSMSSDFYSSLEQQYNRARDKLHAQTKAVEKRKLAYHKAMFNVEKKAIKVKLALTPEVVTNAKNEMRDLTKKALALKDKYLSQILEWRSKFAVLLELTNEMTCARAKKEPVCLDYTLSAMQKEGDSSLNNERDTDADTKKDADLNGDKVQVLREKVCTPVFEDYVPAGRKNEMFEAAFGKKNVDKDGNESDSSDKKGENTETGSKDIEKIENVPVQWKAHISAVIKEYKKKKFDELSLYAGEQVIQMLPADHSGMAFGVKRNGILRKKKGFFPVSHVQENGHLAETHVNREVKSAQTKRTSSNPVLRILDAITEPKTKVSLLQEVASEDDAKVYEDQKKPKKLLCKKKWLRTIYGIDISDDEIYTLARKDANIQTNPHSATDISPERCVFSKNIDSGFKRPKKGTAEHKELVLEDIECTNGHQNTKSGSVKDKQTIFTYTIK